MYSILSKMPKSGSFIRIWEFNGNIWSDSYTRSGNDLRVYDSTQDIYIPIDLCIATEPRQDITNIRYIIIGED